MEAYDRRSWHKVRPPSFKGMSRPSHSQEDAFATSPPDEERYYFDVQDGDRFIPDDEGVVLRGIEEAEAEALTALPDIARGAKVNGVRDFVVEVRDESDRKLTRVRLSLVVEPLA